MGKKVKPKEKCPVLILVQNRLLKDDFVIPDLIRDLTQFDQANARLIAGLIRFLHREE